LESTQTTFTTHTIVTVPNESKATPLRIAEENAGSLKTSVSLHGTSTASTDYKAMIEGVLPLTEQEDWRLLRLELDGIEEPLFISVIIRRGPPVSVNPPMLLLSQPVRHLTLSLSGLDTGLIDVSKISITLRPESNGVARLAGLSYVNIDLAQEHFTTGGSFLDIGYMGRALLSVPILQSPGD
jgi:hypothetical protein